MQDFPGASKGYMDVGGRREYVGYAPSNEGLKAAMRRQELLKGYEEAQALARGGSQAASALFRQYLSPGTAYVQGRQGPLKSWDPSAAFGITKAVQEESALLGKMKAQESTYDKAFAEALQAREMAKTGTGVFQAGSAPQTVIGGAQGAGVEKTGQFKSMYGAGSMLPASWMQSRLDPTQVAQKVSGLENRSGTEQLRVDGKTLTYGRSKFVEPTLNKTGLGKYATISNLTPPASSPQNYFSGGSSRFDETTGKYL